MGSRISLEAFGKILACPCLNRTAIPRPSNLQASHYADLFWSPTKLRETYINTRFKGTFIDPRKLRETHVTSLFKGTFTDPRKLRKTYVISLFEGTVTAPRKLREAYVTSLLKEHLLILEN
jgi:hypothetical protein